MADDPIDRSLFRALSDASDEQLLREWLISERLVVAIALAAVALVLWQALNGAHQADVVDAVVQAQARAEQACMHGAQGQSRGRP